MKYVLLPPDIMRPSKMTRKLVGVSDMASPDRKSCYLGYRQTVIKVRSHRARDFVPWAALCNLIGSWPCLCTHHRKLNYPDCHPESRTAHLSCLHSSISPLLLSFTPHFILLCSILSSWFLVMPSVCFFCGVFVSFCVSVAISELSKTSKAFSIQLGFFIIILCLHQSSTSDSFENNRMSFCIQTTAWFKNHSYSRTNLKTVYT